MKNVSASICILFLLLGPIGCKNEEVREKTEVIRPIRTLVVKEPKQLERGSIAGRARAAQSVELSFRVGGPLVERPVMVGDIVQKDELVARIDPTDFEAGVQRTQGGVDQARAAVTRAKGDYRREMNIFKEDPGATSEAAIDRKREALSRAKANLKSAKASLNNAENQLQYTKLHSPITGKVVSTYVENYETVVARQKIVRILDNTHIKFDVDVPEQLISYLEFVRDGGVEFDAFPGKEIPAQIAEVATEASPTTRTYRVTLILEQQEEMEVLAGMAGLCRFTLDRSLLGEDPVLTVPSTTLFSEELGNTSFVWVYDSATETVHKRNVSVARISESGADISAGLTQGERVVTAGVHFLKEGQRVRLISPQQIVE